MLLNTAEFWQISSTQTLSVGQRYTDTLGRTFRYGQAGSSNLAVGKLVVEADLITLHQGLSFARVPAIGDTVVYVTLGATALASNYYAGGVLSIISGTGAGQSFGIASHPAALASGTVAITLTEAVRVAGATGGTNVNLSANPYQSVVISVTDQLDVAVGVPQVAITALYWGFFQTGGQGSVLIDETIAIGQACTIGSGTAGAIEAADAAGEQVVCFMGPKGGVDTEYDTVSFCIDGPTR